MCKIKSIDVGNYLRWKAFEAGYWLNKTQLQKMLYITYGLYIAKYEEPPFTDDAPKAWPFGPVFPIVNKRIDIDTEPLKPFNLNEIEAHTRLNDIVGYVVATYSGYSARALSEWSHEEGGPWHTTLFSEKKEGFTKWNKEITNESIKNYFKENFLNQ